MCAVSLQFKILCRRIDKNTWSSCRNIDSFTDGYTDGMVPIGILPRVEKHLRNCVTITDDNTNGLVPVDIIPRVEKQLWNCATITDGYTDRLVPVGILPRVEKHLWSVPQSPTGTPINSLTVGVHPETHACQRPGQSARLPTKLPTSRLPTDRKVWWDF